MSSDNVTPIGAKPSSASDGGFRGICIRAAQQYRKAAEEFTRAGDLELAAQIARDTRRYLRIANAADPWAMASRLDGTFGT